MIKPYQLLAGLYNQSEWGKFSLKYIDILDYFKKKYKINPKTVLDISCGTGILINELSKFYKVIGADASEDMIRIARNNYPAIDFYVSDMGALDLGIKVDLILSPFDSINYIITKEHLQQTTKNIYRLLNKNAYFVFDFNTDNFYLEKHHGTIKREINNINFKQILEYEKENRIAKTIFDFGNNSKEFHIQKAYKFEEIKEVLNANNFRILDSINIYSNQDTNDKSFKILLLTTKTNNGI